ncbi:DNA topoisomerase 2 [Arachnomyces sp. PD_36]|nr:DNA topoisomerase 2 [Arachnomyces sp. PD_36]
MDSDLDDPMFDDESAGSDFAPVAPKAKAKPAAKAPKKAAAPKAAPKKKIQTTLKPKATAKTAASKKRAKPESEDEGSGDEQGADDGSLLSSTPPNVAKKAKKSAAPRSNASKPLSNVENESVGMDGAEDPKPKAGSKSSDQYQRLTQLEHIIKRPDTYVGSIERTEKQMWVFNSSTETMEYREVSYVPGLYKIFDEIVVNAADNKQNDKNMNEMRITVDRESGEISVWNNGRGIPIEIHSKEKIYIPELIFGHLLTSSNYDDDQQKVTGGRNGYGAKLCNIFSTEFTLETVDSRSKKKYKQTWTDNMGKMGKAKITDAKGEDYTKVTFKPDYQRFGMTGIDDDFEALVKRRVYDLAGTAKVAVKLNGARVPVRKFKQYMEMYTKAIKKERGEEAAADKNEIITDNPDPNWEVGFAVSDGSFQQVSFVNSIATTSGGSHVNYISDQICTRLAEVVKKKNKQGATLKTAQIRNHIFIFVNCLIVNPAFTSQTKEQLTTKPSQFGSKCPLSDAFLKKIQNTEVINNILHFAEQKADQILKKADGGRRTRMNNPKLTDANKAGTKEGHHCTLILTEGESAKGLAMAGRAVVGPDLFGVFPLRGKLLNVRDASVDQISKNAEIQNIKNFIGLQHKKHYTDTRGLRYGHIMIMTDQDHDGSHIKGLLINFLQVAFPSLLQIPEFLIEFITPIVKVYKGDPKNPTKSKSFFTMPEYEAWKEEHSHERGWEHKYYKGLGTSSTEDAQVYFHDLDKHLKEFHTLQDNETQLIDLAFSKKKADERKEWLRQFKPGTYLDHSSKKITYTDFINKELILFSMADNIRSIPSVVDGLKPGQRKVLYTCFKRNVKKDIKVVELAGHVSGMTAYQHGDVSMQQTIVGLAQTFVGSNNINYLEPSGNFGSRLQGGSDCASARYIYTRLSPFARRVFNPADEPLLTYNTDDHRQIEPEMYVPIVPMILINGADGIGTGWSSSIPNYNPEEVVANLKKLMDGEPVEPMQPWFRGFTGEVVCSGTDRYKFSGIIKETGPNEVEITELPIRTWTQDFKDKLEDIIKAEKVPSFIKDYKDYNTHTKVHFIIQLDEKHMKTALSEGLEEKFKLTKSIATSNLVAFDPEGRITKYASVDDILKEFYALRIKFYEKRKQWQLSELQKELDKLTNQARFVQMIIDGKLVISKKKKKDLIVELKQKGFKAFPKVADAVQAGETAPAAEDEEGEEEDLEIESSSYDYLLGMALWSLTQERVEKLRRQIGDREMEVDALIKLSKEDIWKKDLDEFLEEWRFQLEDEEKRRKKLAGLGRRASTKLKTAAKSTARKRKALGDDPDDGDFGVRKPKKATTTVNHVKPKNGLLNYLGKASPKGKQPAKNSRAKDTGVDGADDFDDLDEVVPPKSKSSSADASKTKEESDEEVIPMTTSRTARTARKPIKYANSSGSDSENGDDLLGDVSKMVKGIGGSGGDSVLEPRTLFSERSRPGSSTGLKPTTKPSKAATEFDPDETDYSKLVPQQSPRRSLVVKSKEPNPVSDEDEEPVNAANEDEDSDEVVVTKSKKAPAAKAKAAPAKSAKASTTTARGKGKKETTKAAAPAKKLQPSPAAKAYASKQAKASKKKISDDLSDDDIDAMANDILDSPSAGVGGDPDSDDSPAPPVKKAAAPASTRPSRRAAATSKKPAYVIEDDSDEEDDFDGDEPSDEDVSDFD